MSRCDVYDVLHSFSHQTDSNGCVRCVSANVELPPPVTDTDCGTEQPSCDNCYLFGSKLTEITNCNEGGIDGATHSKAPLVPNKYCKNIYVFMEIQLMHYICHQRIEAQINLIILVV